MSRVEPEDWILRYEANCADRAGLARSVAELPNELPGLRNEANVVGMVLCFQQGSGN
jgi:hypothetical protein